MNGVLENKTIFALLIALFLVVNVGGAFTVETMMDDAMYNCPFMGVPTLCAMSPLEHLSQWQQTFATMTQPLASAFLLLLVLVMFWYFYQDHLLSPQTREYAPRYRGGGRIFDPLRLAFARGILNSKAY